MRMQPLDRLEACEAAELEPTAVRAYLIEQGWREAGKYGRGSELFARDTADGLAELVLPTSANPSDRALLMTSLVSGLSGVENRPAGEIIENILSKSNFPRLIGPDGKTLLCVIRSDRASQSRPEKMKEVYDEYKKEFTVLVTSAEKKGLPQNKSEFERIINKPSIKDHDAIIKK